MKTFLTIAAIGLLTLGSASRARADGDSDLMDLEGTKPVTVQKDKLIRITGRGIAGGTVTLKLEGVGKIDRTYNVTKVKNGQILLGALIKEFIIKPTEKGKITATVTRKTPSGESETDTYEITVE
jgi:hypothetical protein